MPGKALIVAIENYLPPADRLYAPLEEMDRWARLLQTPKYGFDSIVTLPDKLATKTAVLDAFDDLLKGAAKDEKIMFIFLGHGCVSRSLGGARGRRQPQQALLAYPSNPLDLRTGAITDREFTEHIAAAAPPEGTDFTMVLDCCFSGDFRIDLPYATEHERRVHKLYAPLPEPEISERDVAAARTFGSFFELATRIERPIILTACDRNTPAHEAEIEGTWRMLMSRRALEELEKNPDQPQRLTYAELVHAIYPVHPHYVQRPILLGNVDRKDEPFGGQPGSSQRIASRVLAAREAAATAGVIETLNVRVEGICCYLDASTSPPGKRLVMPHDSRTTDERHIAFVEIAQDDIDRYIGIGPTEIYQHEVAPIGLGTVSYYRWDLSGHRIEIINAATTGGLQLTSGFNHHLPRMTAILPELRLTPDDRCFETNPPPELLAGYFDITAGRLDSGPLMENALGFEPPRNWPERRDPLYTWLQLPLTSSPARVRIIDTTGASRDTEIFLKAGTAAVRIGNAQELDIIGPGSGENYADNFFLYYHLSDRDTYGQLPRPLPRPKKPVAPINACSNTGWP